MIDSKPVILPSLPWFFINFELNFVVHSKKISTPFENKHFLNEITNNLYVENIFSCLKLV